MNTSLPGSILDLVLTNREALIEGTTVFQNGFDSDHFPVCFSMKPKFDRPKNCARTVYCYALSYIPWDSIISCDDMDSSATNFQDLVLAAVDMHIPMMKLRHKGPYIQK